jgi:hypothetical protein
MPRNVMTFDSWRADLRMAAIERLLADGVPRTTPEIAKAIFLDRAHARPYMIHMHKQGRVHIKKWKRMTSPMYLAGPGKDAKQPTQKKTLAENQQAYYKRMKSNPEFKMKLQSRERAASIMPEWKGSRQRHYAKVIREDA